MNSPFFAKVPWKTSAGTTTAAAAATAAVGTSWDMEQTNSPVPANKASTSGFLGAAGQQRRVNTSV